MQVTWRQIWIFFWTFHKGKCFGGLHWFFNGNIIFTYQRPAKSSVWELFCIVYFENQDVEETHSGGTLQDPHWFEILVIFDFLHHRIDEVERHLLWKFHKKIQRKSWSNVPPKLLACIRFLYKVVHNKGRLRKLNRSREIEFNFFTAWSIFMKLGTLAHHVHGYKTLPQIFNFCLGT